MPWQVLAESRPPSNPIDFAISTDIEASTLSHPRSTQSFIPRLCNLTRYSSCRICWVVQVNIYLCFWALNTTCFLGGAKQVPHACCPYRGLPWTLEPWAGSRTYDRYHRFLSNRSRWYFLCQKWNSWSQFEKPTRGLSSANSCYCGDTDSRSLTVCTGVVSDQSVTSTCGSNKYISVSIRHVPNPVEIFDK